MHRRKFFKLIIFNKQIRSNKIFITLFRMMTLIKKTPILKNSIFSIIGKYIYIYMYLLIKVKKQDI